jgi:cellulose synthase/poly-beta-1,6-N-acetylglucosamine synthase-like glycosyltransferase
LHDNGQSRTAQGDFIAFLDDDNWPAPDWVIQAVKFGQSHPQAGAYGGKIQGCVLKCPLGKMLLKVQRFLAIRDYGNKATAFSSRKYYSCLLVRLWLSANVLGSKLFPRRSS